MPAFTLAEAMPPELLKALPAAACREGATAAAVLPERFIPGPPLGACLTRDTRQMPPHDTGTAPLAAAAVSGSLRDVHYLLAENDADHGNSNDVVDLEEVANVLKELLQAMLAAGHSFCGCFC